MMHQLGRGFDGQIRTSQLEGLKSMIYPDASESIILIVH